MKENQRGRESKKNKKIKKDKLEGIVLAHQ
jgi:hypothetical protein